MKNLLMCTVLMCLCVVFSSCSEDIEVVNLYSNKADFVVENLMTGEKDQNLGGVLNVKNGDVLEMVYTPGKEYRKFKWTVDFELFSKETQTVEKSPYSFLYTVSGMNPGEYVIECMATIKEGKNIHFAGMDYGKVKVKVME